MAKFKGTPLRPKLCREVSSRPGLARRPCSQRRSAAPGGPNFHPLDTNTWFGIDVCTTGDVVTRHQTLIPTKALPARSALAPARAGETFGRVDESHRLRVGLAGTVKSCAALENSNTGKI